MKLWRGEGIRCVMYIDDGIIMSEGRGRAEKESRYIRGSLEAAGLVVNEEKSNWEPRQCGKWLGFELDTAAGHISVPQGKIENLKVILAQVRAADQIVARRLASLGWPDYFNESGIRDHS